MQRRRLHCKVPQGIHFEEIVHREWGFELALGKLWSQCRCMMMRMSTEFMFRRKVSILL